MKNSCAVKKGEESDDKKKGDTDEGTEGDQKKGKKGQRPLITRAEIENNVAFVEWKAIKRGHKILQGNVQRKRTDYFLSNKDEEKKKAMDDAEKNLKLS